MKRVEADSKRRCLITLALQLCASWCQWCGVAVASHGPEPSTSKEAGMRKKKVLRVR